MQGFRQQKPKLPDTVNSNVEREIQGKVNNDMRWYERHKTVWHNRVTCNS